jgi:hypothetical protein
VAEIGGFGHGVVLPPRQGRAQQSRSRVFERGVFLSIFFFCTSLLLLLPLLLLLLPLLLLLLLSLQPERFCHRCARLVVCLLLLLPPLLLLLLLHLLPLLLLSGIPRQHGTGTLRPEILELCLQAFGGE